MREEREEREESLCVCARARDSTHTHTHTHTQRHAETQEKDIGLVRSPSFCSSFSLSHAASAHSARVVETLLQSQRSHGHMARGQL